MIFQNTDDTYSPALELPQLTFSRFIAAIAIVFFHFSATAFPFSTPAVANVVIYLKVLVSYFFVLSGFLLTINVKSNMAIKEFYINRFSRIYPLYFFAFLLTVSLIFNARTTVESPSFHKLSLSILLIQSWFKDYAMAYNFPGWSLSVEAFFYLLFPAVIFIFRNTGLIWQLTYVFVFWLVMQVAYIYMIKHEQLLVLANPLFHLSTFLVGMAAGKLYKSKFARMARNISTLEILSTIAGIIIFVLIVSKNEWFAKFYLNGFLAPVFVLFIYTLALSKLRLIKAFSNKKLQYLGQISYGIYILQFPMWILTIGIIDRTIKTSPTATFYIYLGALICISSITYELIEKPCRKLIRNRFGNKAALKFDSCIQV